MVKIGEKQKNINSAKTLNGMKIGEPKLNENREKLINFAEIGGNL